MSVLQGFRKNSGYDDLRLHPAGGLRTAPDSPEPSEAFRIWHPWEIRMQQASETGQTHLHGWIAPAGAGTTYTSEPLHLEGCRDFSVDFVVLPGGSGSDTVKLYLAADIQETDAYYFRSSMLTDGGSTVTITRHAVYGTHYRWSSRNMVNAADGGPKWRGFQPLWVHLNFECSAALTSVMLWVIGEY